MKTHWRPSQNDSSDGTFSPVPEIPFRARTKAGNISFKKRGFNEESAGYIPSYVCEHRQSILRIFVEDPLEGNDVEIVSK
jgi:hypothetical protein